MYRLRIINTNVVPSDHLLDVEGLPASFIQVLPLQPKTNWIHKDKPEYMIDYKSNQWDELEKLMNRYAHEGKMPKPACLVDTDDTDRAKILPRTLQDENVPLLILDTPESMRKETQSAPVVTSFFCPECDFEGKAQIDIEGHMSEKHGINVMQRGQDGKALSVSKPSTPKADVPIYACMSCSFESPDKAELQEHSNVHRAVESDAFACMIENCTFVGKSQAQLRGHKMGAHKKQKVGA